MWHGKILGKNIHFERFQRILCGVLLVMLAISSVPVTLIEYWDILKATPIKKSMRPMDGITIEVAVHKVTLYSAITGAQQRMMSNYQALPTRST